MNAHLTTSRTHPVTSRTQGTLVAACGAVLALSLTAVLVLELRPLVPPSIDAGVQQAQHSSVAVGLSTSPGGLPLRAELLTSPGGLPLLAELPISSVASGTGAAERPTSPGGLPLLAELPISPGGLPLRAEQ